MFGDSYPMNVMWRHDESYEVIQRDIFIEIYLIPSIWI
jgi:hypothetical protein